MQTATDLLPLHERALHVFRRVLDGVQQDQLSTQSPCTEWDVRAVIDHIIGLNELVGTGTVQKPTDGSTPTIDDLRRVFGESTQEARATLAAPGAMERTFTMPWGDMTGESLLTIAFLDLVIHAWDVASATGQKSLLDPELCEVALNIGQPMMAGRPRDPKTGFGPEVEIADDAPICDRLAAFYGRQP